MTSKVRIVAAVLDTEMLKLYTEVGMTIEIKQGDKRVQRIIDEVTEPLSTQGWADVDLQADDPAGNVYNDFQKLAAGVIQFFRVHKTDLLSLFEQVVETTQNNGSFGTDKHLAPVSLGNIPGTAPQQTSTEAPVAADIQDAVKNERPSMEEATRQIMASAKPVTDGDFSSQDTKEHETMIAAVADKTTGKHTIVPGMEHLQAQFANAARLGSTGGVTKFLERIAAVINARKHTIDELLNFMSRGDLPIADDGSIVAYKVLQSTSPSGYFVDCHSKNVKQRVGSFVSQENVDENRRLECSTGLHIARRGYLRSFRGDIIVLVKIAPEDVMAVPLNEPNKMRARGYHIISEVPKNDHEALRDNRPIQSDEAKKLLAMAIKGDHIGIIEDVVIGGPTGTKVAVTPREAEVKKAPRTKKSTPIAEAIEADPKVAQNNAPTVDPKKTSDAALTAKTETRGEKAARLLAIVNSNAKLPERRDAAQVLLGFKKASKASWNKLGVEAAYVTVIEQLATAQEDPAPKETPVAVPPVESEKTGTKKKPAPVLKAADVVPSSAQPTRAEKVKQLLHKIDKGKSKAIRQEAYQALIALKRASKTGWSQLGVDNFDELQAKFEGK